MAERQADDGRPERRERILFGHHFESNVDRIVREAMERGEFDGLPGEGKPIPGAGQKDDEFWWVRRWLRRNEEGS